MTRIHLALAGTLLLALGAAACDRGPSTPQPTQLITDPDQMQLYVGESGTVVSELMRDDHTVQKRPVEYWVRDLTVARVTPEGQVAAVAPGTTLVMARWHSLVDSVRVTVRPDNRRELHTLDILPGEVIGATGAGNVTIPYVAVDGYGHTVCTPNGFTLVINSVIALASNASQGTVCVLSILPQAEGETWLVALADGLRDSVRVKVLNGGYQASFTDDALGTATVGVPRTLTVRIVNARGEPVPGRAVQFTASPGFLAQTTDVTDANGLAHVGWTPQTSLAASGSTARVEFRTSFPTGAGASGGAYVRVVAGAPTAMDWFYTDSYGYYTYAISSGTLGVISSSLTTPPVFATGRDTYGNRTAVLPQVTWRLLTDSSAVSQAAPSTISCSGNTPGAYYYSCVSGMQFQLAKPGVVRMYARVGALPADSVDILVRKN